MKKNILLQQLCPLLAFFVAWLGFALPPAFASAAVADTVVLTKTDAEKQFLQNNLLLLSERLNIQQAEAFVVQARLWPNPSLEIDEVNLWATPRQLSMGEELPALAGNSFGRNRQVAVQLEQVLLTAGKRKKFIALEEVSRDMSMAYFEDLLRNLKVEFRNSLTELQYLQFYAAVFDQQLGETQQLVAAYERQARTGNVNQGEVIRLKALQLELRHESKEIRESIHEFQKEVTVLMGLPAESYLVIDPDGFIPTAAGVPNLLLSDLIQQAYDHRPDLQVARLEQRFRHRNYDYQQALKVPDVTLKGGYDRGGNFLLNFIGFGIGIDLPVFNRNQGNIKAARIGVEQGNLIQEEASRRVEAEVVAAFRNVRNSSAFFDGIEPGYDQDLDRLLDSYTRNFRSRNVGMLEFLDFFEAYLNNKRNILNAQRDLNIHLEELNYAIGSEITY